MGNDLMLRKTKKLALDTLKYIDTLPKTMACYVLGKQLLRSGTSVYSNYRAVCRARSKPDFIAKLGIVEEESDETMAWIELLTESGKVSGSESNALYNQAKEILAMTIASLKTAKRDRDKR